MDFDRYEELKRQYEHIKQKAMNCANDLERHDQYMECANLIHEQMQEMLAEG